MDNKPRGFNILHSSFHRGCDTYTLPPITDILKERINQNKQSRENTLLTSQVNGSNPIIDKERLDLLNKLRCAEETENTKENEISLSKSNLSPKSIGEDVVMLENTNDLSDVRKKIYNIIISAFKAKKISDSSIYCILQNIPYIDIINDVIVIYTKRISIFEEIQVPCVNIALALKEGFKNKDLKIKFIPFKVTTIADYFSKTNWNAKLH